jgi:hypothetical protein
MSKASPFQRLDSDEDALRERARLEMRLTEEVIDDDIVHVMSDAAGRRFVAFHLRANGEDPTMPQTSFTGNSTTFKLEGRREAAKMLQARIIKACPQLFMQMWAENFINEATES